MTAIGFFIFVVAYIVINMSPDFIVPEWIELTAFAMAFSGVVMMLCGVTAWLWKVMP
jgi:hypothetical protein